MLWKKTLNYAPYYKFVAVLEAEEINVDHQIYGIREFRLKLADGTFENKSFEAEEYRLWWSSFLKGGVVINP